MSNITKAITMIAVLVLALFTVVTGASAAVDSLGVTVLNVKINGDSLNANQAFKTQFERDDELDVRVQLQTDGSTTVEDVEIVAFISGAKDDISDTVKEFNVQPNTIYTKSLELELPERTKDRDYQLRLIITSPNSDTLSFIYPLVLEPVDTSISIRDVVFSPNDKVVAGRALTAVVRLKNFGQVDEDDVKVVVRIPELGIQEVDYINEIEKDETVSSEELLLRIPRGTQSGEYIVDVEVFFDDLDESTSASFTIMVDGETSTGSVTGKTTIAVGLQSQTAARGENGVIFPLTLTNGASVAKTYTLVVSGADSWATTKISPSNVVVLNAGESKQAFVFVAANANAAVGEHVFSVDVQAGNEVVKQIPLKVDVLESARSNTWNGVKGALQVGVILLVVLIVVLGIVIAYQRNNKEGDNKGNVDEIAQTYY